MFPGIVLESNHGIFIILIVITNIIKNSLETIYIDIFSKFPRLSANFIDKFFFSGSGT